MQEFHVRLRRMVQNVTTAMDVDRLHDALEEAAGDTLNTSGIGWDESSGEVTFDLWLYASTSRMAWRSGIELVATALTLSSVLQSQNI